MANNYVTSTDTFSDVSEGSFSTSDYPMMENIVAVTSRLIDREFGRWDGFFYPSTDDVTYYDDGSGETEQEIDEFVSITSVSVSEQGGYASTDYTTWTLNTDYLVYPYNYSTQGKPIHKLLITDYNNAKGAFHTGQRSIKVVGIAGYSTTPPDLVLQACKLQSIRWFMRAKQGWQDTGANDELGSREYKGMAELDPDVRAMLWGLKLELQR